MAQRPQRKRMRCDLVIADGTDSNAGLEDLGSEAAQAKPTNDEKRVYDSERRQALTMPTPHERQCMPCSDAV
jgi:hypothetical protein